MLGWIWLIANAIQLYSELSERSTRIAALEQELAKTSGKKRRAEIEKQIKEIREKTIHCDAGATAVLNESKKTSVRD